MTNPPFDLTKDNVLEFEETDKFNGNLLKGFLYRDANLKYGMLYLTHVNGKPAPQSIWATPKMHYPYNHEGVWSFPRNISHIEVYEKLDGTNILAYQYQDTDGNKFVSYKTRLRPTIVDGKFGRFESLWREILKSNPTIPEFVIKSGDNISFELYGKRNKVLVEYPNSLDAKILFGRRNELVIPPSAYNLKQFNLESAPLITIITGESELITEYQKVVTYLNEHLKVTKLPDEETIQMIEGMEGSIWYVIADNTIQIKCKPDIIRDIHMAGVERIPTHSIYTTVINSFEENDNPTIDDIKKLLIEEFSESMVEKKIPTIEKILAEVRFTNILRAEVLEEYHRHPEFDMINNRGLVMRHFSSKYDKDACGKIFKLLWDEYGLVK
jgi:hypothetical protein